MAEADSIRTQDRLALSALLIAGADPDRLASWYADNSDSSHDDITEALAGLQDELVH